MPEGPFGIFPRLTKLGPFTKVTVDELNINTKNGRDLTEHSKEIYDSIPSFAKDTEKFGQFIQNQHQDKIRQIYKLSELTDSEASMAICLETNEELILFTEDDINIGNIEHTDTPFLKCIGRPVGSIHSHLRLGPTAPEVFTQFGRVPRHYPSSSDILNTLNLQNSGTVLTAGLGVIVAVGTNDDKKVSVYTAFDDATRKAILIFNNNKLKREEKAEIYQKIVTQHMYEFKI